MVLLHRGCGGGAYGKRNPTKLLESAKNRLKKGNQTVTNCNQLTAGEYKRFKGLRKQNLRDNMTNMELILSMLADESTRQISASTLPNNMIEHHQVAASGGSVARNARIEIERKTGRRVVSPLNASDTGALDVDSDDMLPPPAKDVRGTGPFVE